MTDQNALSPELDYYARPEVSNSDLTWIKKEFSASQEERGDIETAYKNGTLLDCLITEPYKVNIYKKTCAGYAYTDAEIARGLEMKKAFYRDAFCAGIVKHAEFQKVTVVPNFAIELDGFVFHNPGRCKWDLFIESFDLSGDIKSTAAKTQKQFEEAVRYFEYDRQRAYYLDLINAANPHRKPRTNDVLIGVSKFEPFNVFKVPVKLGSELYRAGRERYADLAFKYWYLFGNCKPLTNAL